MSSFRRRQSSDYNQSVPETEFIPENHAYQEKHFQPTLNKAVAETHSETEYGSTVTPDTVESRATRVTYSVVSEKSDQPGEDDLLNARMRQNLQGNSDPGTQYSTPDVSSGVSSDPGGFSTFSGGSMAAAASTSTAASTVVASSTVASISSVAVATAGAVMVAATLILPLVIGVPTAIIFEDISVTDTTIYYSIYFEDYEEGMDLTVSLHNNFTDRSHAVESHIISVLEEDLRPGMDYKLTVYGSMGVVLDERTVTTEETSPEPTPPEPTFTVEAAEFSTSDALIHVSATLDDPESRYSDFSVVFYDVKDDVRTEVRRVSVSNFSSEISFSPGLAKDTSVDGILAVECKDNGDTKVLYEDNLTAYGSLYIGFKTLPRIIDGTVPVECIIVDPESLRSNYQAWVYIENADNQKDVPYDTNGVLENGIFTATGVPDYQLHSGTIKVTWDGEDSNTPLIRDYNSLILGAATMVNDPITYQGDDYETRLTVDMTVDDDFQCLVDSSGNWLSSKTPSLARAVEQTDRAVFKEIVRTGDNTYVAVFLSQSWNSDSMYRLENLFMLESGYTKELHMFTDNGYPEYTTRGELGEITAIKTFYGQTTVGSAKALADDGTEVPCTLGSTTTQNSCEVHLDLTDADPYGAYTILLYDTSGNLMFKDDDETFDYPVLVSATYVEQSQSYQVTATVVFDYPVQPVYMPGRQPDSISYDGNRITMVFTLNAGRDAAILNGEQPFQFAVQDVSPASYYWTTVFTKT